MPHYFLLLFSRRIAFICHIHELSASPTPLLTFFSLFFVSSMLCAVPTLPTVYTYITYVFHTTPGAIITLLSSFTVDSCLWKTSTHPHAYANMHTSLFLNECVCRFLFRFRSTLVLMVPKCFVFSIDSCRIDWIWFDLYSNECDYNSFVGARFFYIDLTYSAIIGPCARQDSKIKIDIDAHFSEYCFIFSY